MHAFQPSLSVMYVCTLYIVQCTVYTQVTKKIWGYGHDFTPLSIHILSKIIFQLLRVLLFIHHRIIAYTDFATLAAELMNVGPLSIQSLGTHRSHRSPLKPQCPDKINFHRTLAAGNEEIDDLMQRRPWPELFCSWIWNLMLCDYVANLEKET